MTPPDAVPSDPPMVRMSVEFLRTIVEPHGGHVQHGPVDPEGYVTNLIVYVPQPEKEARRDRRSRPRSEGER